MVGFKKTLSIKGTITIGNRGLFVDDEEKILEPISNSFSYGDILKRADKKGYKYIKLGSSSRFALMDNEIFGYYGLRKFYHPLDNDVGVLVFYSIYKKHPPNKRFTKEGFVSYVNAAKYLLNFNIFPEIIETCKVDLNCKVKVCESNKIRLKLKNSAYGIITKRLEIPQYDLDIENHIHRKVLKKAWGNKKFRPFQWDSETLKILYGENFINKNPLFTKKEYVKFCKKINSIYREKSNLFKKVSVGKWPPETKYGDVVYCVKNKRWYFGDLE